MAKALIPYKRFTEMRESLAREYSPTINMSSNAQMVFGDVYLKKLETGIQETIPQRMATVALDVASNELRYLPKNMSLEERTAHVDATARKYLDLYAKNIFRANTPTNINFGRWRADYDENGKIIGYNLKQQMGSACFVIPVEDTFGESVEKVTESEGILAAWVSQQMLQKGGGGTGFSFCALRPKGSLIGYTPAVDGIHSIDWESQRGSSSGAESFLEFYFNSSTEAVKQGNTRRGANMGIQRIDHMDFLDHIYAKFGRDKNRLEYRLKNFNLSLAVTDEFMEKASKGEFYTLYNPHRSDEKTRKVLKNKFDIENPELVRKSDLATKKQFEKIMAKNAENPFAPVATPSMYLADNGVDVINAYMGEKIGIILGDIVHIDAAKVLDTITQVSHANGEPGMVFLDRINEYNPILDVVEYDSTNPCGEQPLPPNGACNLGSNNAGKFARYQTFNSRSEAKSSLDKLVLNDRFTKVEDRKDGRVGVVYYDWNSLDDSIETGIRFLDNVIDRSDFPSQKVTKTVRDTRKVGLGYFGVADAMILMKMRYGSEKSIEFAEALAKRLHDKSREVSQKLAEERGVFPLWKKSFFNPKSEHYKWFTSNPKSIRDRFRGSRKLSDLVDRGRNMKYGIRVRNAYQTTEAPTGTIRRTVGEKDRELSLDNLAISSATEPVYSLEETSNILNTKVKDFSLGAVELLKREGLFSKEIIEAIKANKGSAHIYSHTPKAAAEVLSAIPKDIRDVLVTAAGGEKNDYEITAEQHVKVATAFQKYTDSAVSKTINLPFSATVEDIKDSYFTLWKGGSKGGTIYRDRSRKFQILNTTEQEAIPQKNSNTGSRPLLQEAFALQLPYIRSSQKEEKSQIEYHPDSCFTIVSFNPLNGGITGVFQNVAEVDTEVLSLMNSRNIALSRDLKNGRSLDEVIRELEKVGLEGSRKGMFADERVMPSGKENLRFSLEGSTTTQDLLNTLYVTRFLTENGKNLKREAIHEKLSMYYGGDITLRSIINTQGMLKIGEANSEFPSILGRKKTVIVAEETSKKLCPECG